jgi:hypothetical protein
MAAAGIAPFAASQVHPKIRLDALTEFIDPGYQVEVVSQGVHISVLLEKSYTSAG